MSDESAPAPATAEDPVIPPAIPPTIAPPAAPPEPPPEPMAPTSAEERVEVIDVIRGLALFGILAANIRGFAGPAIAYFNPSLFWPGFADRVAQAFIDTFIQGKFVTIFAFLFGVGFAVQLGRAESRRVAFGWYYVRRNFLLVLIGFVHGMFIWFGDILLPYGITGMLLLFFRKRRDKTLLIWAVVALLVPVLLTVAAAMAVELGGLKIPQPPDMKPDRVQAAVRAYADGSWSDVQRQRAHDAATQNWALLPAMLWHILGLFLLGMLAWRGGFFTPDPASLPRYRKAMIWGLIIGLAGNAFITAVRWIHNIPMFPPSTINAALYALQLVAVPALSLGYMCAIILLYHDRLWRQRFRRFAAIGRTALSNYLLQSVVGTLLFYSYGFGLFGRIGPALLLIPTVIIYALQAIISPWWLSRFRFGPVEWLWRTLTYGRLQPMSRRVDAITAT